MYVYYSNMNSTNGIDLIPSSLHSRNNHHHNHSHINDKSIKHTHNQNHTIDPPRQTNNNNHYTTNATISIYDDDNAGEIESGPTVTRSQFVNCTELSLSIIDRLLSHTYECSICSELIHDKQYIWNCTQCSVILHLKCIQRYYDTISQQNSLTSHQSQTTFRCPTCLYTYLSKPIDYLCYCTAELQPINIPYILPHSCGKQCNKLLQCSKHTCAELCHPGPCNRCTRYGGTIACYCNRSTIQLKCGESDTNNKSCGMICNKQLRCYLDHSCNDLCHSGPCNVCMELVKQSCYCNKHTGIVRPCGLADSINQTNNILQYNCGEQCNKLLDCGNHYCSKLCHSGACDSCSDLPSLQQHCACNQTIIPSNNNTIRQSCLAPLPTCQLVCNKPLSCGRHNCTQPCHNGACTATCAQSMDVACRCMRNIITISCNEYNQLPIDTDSNTPIVTCKQRCTIKLSCRQCQCHELCCSPAVNLSHLCTKICGKQLNCQLHTCDSFHHTGKCHTCTVVYTDGLACACGRTRTMPNTVCGTLIRPQCTYPCSKKRSCGHSCTYACHPDDCPPCAVLCSKKCAGQHRLLNNIPCYAIAPSCGQKCGQLLQCGTHTCTKNCHASTIPCGLTAISQLTNNTSVWSKQSSNQSNTNNSGVASVPSCGQKCLQPKPCTHLCQQKCHPAAPCDTSIPCNDTVVLTCPCGRIKQNVKCHSQANHIVECNDECARIIRNIQLQSALNIDTNNNSIQLPYPTKLLDDILAANIINQIQKYEKIVYNFAMSTDTTYYFNSMPNIQRWLIHQLAQCYGVWSEALDVGAQRSIRLYKDSNTHVRRPSMNVYDTVILYKKMLQDKQCNNIDTSRQLHLYGCSLTPTIQPNDLYSSILRAFNGTFQCNWTDKNHDHIILTFHTVHSKNNACNELMKRQLFESTPEHDDTNNHDVIHGTALYRRHTIKTMHHTNTHTTQQQVNERWINDKNKTFRKSSSNRSSKTGTESIQPNNAFQLLDEQ